MLMRNVRDGIRLKLCFYYIPFVSLPPSHNLSPSPRNSISKSLWLKYLQPKQFFGLKILSSQTVQKGTFCGGLLKCFCGNVVSVGSKHMNVFFLLSTCECMRRI